MKLPSGRIGLYVLFCWLYIGIGLCSLAAGVYLTVMIRQMGASAPSGLSFIAFILVLFGPLRIANSVWALGKLGKQRRP